VAGCGRDVPSFLYVFVDTFIGGGLVIDGRLQMGHRGNAGAIGSLPLALATSQTQPAQLLNTASLQNLEERFQAHGLDARAAYDERALQAPWATHSQAWVEQTALGIAMAVNASASMLDLQGVIIDGSFCRGLHQQLVEAVRQALAPLPLGWHLPT
jgi:predicted NBD/HSP70 family sugar kinase